MSGHKSRIDGWFQMSLAPKDGPILLLVFDSSELRAFVGQWDDGWVVRHPLSSSRSMVVPRRWAPLPDFPKFAY
jgi:hypothetical protein